MTPPPVTLYSVQVEGPGVEPGTVRVRIIADVPQAWAHDVGEAQRGAVNVLQASSALLDGFKEAARRLGGR